MVLITGASSGIGEACARAFVAAGRKVILCARRKDRLEALARELGSQALVLELDVRDAAAVEKALHPLAHEVDTLVNNAGLARGREPLQQGTVAHWNEMIDTNIRGVLQVTRALLPAMIGKKRGHIVMMGSVAGHWNYPDGNVYCATKSAVRSLTECLRMDLLGTGIRVTEVSPGMVKTDFSLIRFGDEKRAKAVYEGVDPLQPSDVADAVLWACQRPAHVNIQEIVLYPTAQASPHHLYRASKPEGV